MKKYVVPQCGSPTFKLSLIFALIINVYSLGSSSVLNIADMTQYLMYVAYQTNFSQEIPPCKL